MNDDSKTAAMMSAMTTEHFVLQTAISSTVSEASARSTLYVMALSSCLVALGFTSQNTEVFIPFALAVLPAIFVLGLFTTMRLVDTSLESMLYLSGIARIHRYYRSLGPEAALQFAAANGRWPEAKQASPALLLGPLLAHLGTTAAMVAIINNVIAGAIVTLLVHRFADGAPGWLPITLGVVVAFVLSGLYLMYERWRFAVYPANAGVDQ